MTIRLYLFIIFLLPLTESYAYDTNNNSSFYTVSDIYKPFDAHFKENLFQNIFAKHFSISSDYSFPVFNTNVDWHSSVHAHWAMFAMALENHSFNVDIVNYILPRLTKEKLSQDMMYLDFLSERDHEGGYLSYELPYGRSWFLLLSITYKKWAQSTGQGDPYLFDSYTEYIVQSLEKLLLTNPEFIISKFFDTGYQSTSWMLSCLWDYYDSTTNLEGKERIRSIVLENLRNGKWTLTPFAKEEYSRGFMSPLGNAISLLVKVLDPSELVTILSPILPQRDEPHWSGLTYGFHGEGYLWFRTKAWLDLLNHYPLTSEQKKWVEVEIQQNAKKGHFSYLTLGDNKYWHWVPQFLVLNIVRQ